MLEILDKVDLERIIGGDVIVKIVIRKMSNDKVISTTVKYVDDVDFYEVKEVVFTENSCSDKSIEPRYLQYVADKKNETINLNIL